MQRQQQEVRAWSASGATNQTATHMEEGVEHSEGKKPKKATRSGLPPAMRLAAQQPSPTAQQHNQAGARSAVERTHTWKVGLLHRRGGRGGPSLRLLPVGELPHVGNGHGVGAGDAVGRHHRGLRVGRLLRRSLSKSARLLRRKSLLEGGRSGVRLLLRAKGGGLLCIGSGGIKGRRLACRIARIGSGGRAGRVAAAAAAAAAAHLGIPPGNARAALGTGLALLPSAVAAAAAAVTITPAVAVAAVTAATAVACNMHTTRSERPQRIWHASMRPLVGRPQHNRDRCPDAASKLRRLQLLANQRDDSRRPLTAATVVAPAAAAKPAAVAVAPALGAGPARREGGCGVGTCM